MKATTPWQTAQQWLSKTLTNHQSFTAYFEPLIQIMKPAYKANLYAARVVDVRTENDRVYSLVLQPPGKWPGFSAGQHVDIHINQSGQNHIRTFSLSQSVDHFTQTGLIELTIRIQELGKITPWLPVHLSAGDHLNITAARGEFTLSQDTEPLLLIAGGSGITPIRSLLHELAIKAPNTDVHLIYYNQGIQPLFVDEFKGLQQSMKYLQLSMIDTEISGLISDWQLSHLCRDFTDRMTYICGPHGLITTARDLLLDRGVNENRIHFELFGPKPIQTPISQQDSVIRFIQSNKQVSVAADQPQTLLSLAEQANTFPTSGCRRGICHQCQYTKQQGLVFNTLTETYSDTGTEDIQLCVSVPVSDVILEL